ncbi:hypothetical protein SAMN05444350_107110 [Bacteroides stercorirosoris]|uniref:Uncharacterized protein n=1 Tax=Bacteroides stercorirosoris TaxID=871324 RepID=A0A1M6DTU3_9BACE|nr:hypothetical protein SAMN05444350_107110 [Bacteroides stercorirosoris]
MHPLSLKGFYLIAQGNTLGNGCSHNLTPCKGKSPCCCYALTGRKEKHMAIPQGVALGYKIKGFQPTRYYHVNEYAERKPCSSATLVNYHL